MGQSSQLEGPTAAVLEDAVVAWHAELQLLPCDSFMPLCFSIHIISRERSQRPQKKSIVILEWPEWGVLAFTYPSEARLDLMMDIMYGAKYRFISMLSLKSAS